MPMCLTVACYNSAAGLVGYSYAADSHPDLSPELYEAILPSNQALLNRSVYANASSQYDLASWTPQVNVSEGITLRGPNEMFGAV